MRNGVYNMTSSSVLRITLVSICGLLIFLAAPAIAATWTGGGGAGAAEWTNSANWGGTAPVAGEQLVFPGGPVNLSSVNDFPAGTTFDSIIFNTNATGYSITGNSVTLTGTNG